MPGNPYLPPAPEAPPALPVAPRGPGPLAAGLAVAATAAGVVAAGSAARSHGALAAVLLPQAVVLLAVAATLALGRWPPAACGMGAPRLRHCLAALGLAPALVLVACLLGGLTILILGPAPGPVAHLDEVLQAIRAMGGWPLLVILACVLPGIGEEALTRGVLLTGVRRRLSAPAAVVVAALVFAALHLTPWRFLPQLALGLAVGALAVRTGSCWPGACTHAAYNLLALGVASAGERGLPTALAALGVAAPPGLWLAWRLLRRDPTRA